MQASLDLRPSPIAGLWYEGDPKGLARAVDEYIAQANLPDLPGEVVAVIAPHAGHRYSGPVAGYAFAAVRGRSPDLVAVIAPMHQPYLQPLITTAHAAYVTPLGAVRVDREAVSQLDRELNSALGYGLTAVSRDREHSLEIELPFLQRALGKEFQLLPVMVRAQEPHVSQTLGLALAKILKDRDALMVASTDLSHYYTQEAALVFDSEMLRQWEAFSPEGAFEAEHQGKTYACGLGALTAVMWAARELGADTVKVLRHATSGDVTGDYSAVVGYGAAAILKTK